MRINSLEYRSFLKRINEYKLKNKTKELAKKAGVKVNNLKDNIAKKGTSAAITAKLGAQAAKKNIKELYLSKKA